MQSALRKIPFFLFLLILFFSLHGSVENYGFLDLYEVIEVTGIIMLVTTIFFGVTWLITKNLPFAALLSFFIALWYLFFGAIHDFIKATPVLSFLQSFSILLPLLLVVNILVAWWLKRKKALYPKLFLYLNLLFIFFCLADIVLLINRHLSFKEPGVAPAVSFQSSAVKTKPNVYFLLFDEYAGYKSLEDSFGFRNDSFYHFLREQQFKEMPVFSNYDFTPFSMSSILNMQYVPENYKKELLVQPDIQNRFGEIRNAHVFSIFRSMGYKIENYSIFDIKGNPALFQSNGLFPIHVGLLTNKLFHKRVQKGIGWWLATGRFEIPFIKEHYMYRKDKYNKDVENMVLESMADDKKPRFCYAHFLLPHGQFYRDSTGAYNPPEKILDLKYLADKSLYLSYLKYTNNIIRGLVQQLNAKDPNAIMVIMSDHGFYDYDNDGGYEPYNFNNICFIRTPVGANPADSLPGSNVNVFRYLFNISYGQKFPYIKDSTIFVIEDPAVLR